MDIVEVDKATINAIVATKNFVMIWNTLTSVLGQIHNLVIVIEWGGVVDEHLAQIVKKADLWWVKVRQSRRLQHPQLFNELP